MIAAGGGTFDGVGGVVVGVLLTWAGATLKRRRDMRAAEIDRSQAEGKEDRELLETIYSALVTADPTPMKPHPTPGLIEKVENIDNRLERLEGSMASRTTFEGEITGAHVEGHIEGTSKE